MRQEFTKLALFLMVLVGCQAKTRLKFEIPKELMEVALRSPPNVSWSQSTQTVDESAGSINLGLRLSFASPLPISVPILPSSDLPGFAGATVEFPPGAIESNVTIPIPQDSIMNSMSPRTASLRLGLPDYANLGLPASVQLMIRDDDRPEISFSVTRQEATEDGPQILIKAKSNKPISKDSLPKDGSPLQVNFTVTPAPSASPTPAPSTFLALKDRDYTLSSLSFSFPEGATESSVTLTPVNNTVANPPRQTILTLTEPSTSVLFRLNPNQKKTQILIMDGKDGGGAPTLGFSPLMGGTQLDQSTFKISYPESAGKISIPILIQPAINTPVSVQVTPTSSTALTGSDFEISTVKVEIPANSKEGSVQLSLVNNSSFKGNRTFKLTLSDPKAGDKRVISLLGITTLEITILEDDPPPSIQFERDLISASEGSSGDIELPVSLSSLSASTITSTPIIGSILFRDKDQNNFSQSTFLGDAIRNEDFSIVLQSVSIPAGSARGVAKIKILDDSTDEDPETIIAELGSGKCNPDSCGTIPVQGRSRMAIAIADNDPDVVLQWTSAAQSADEISGRTVIEATLSAPAGKTITVPFALSGTSRYGVHHTLAASELVIPKGQTKGSVTVAFLQDEISESDKTLILTLSKDGNAVLGQNAVHTLTITDSSGFTPSLAAFETTVYKLVRENNCNSCHSQGNLPRFASENLQEAFAAALANGRTNFSDIPSSLFVTKLDSDHQGYKTRTPLIVGNMIKAIEAWKSGSIGAKPTPSPGGGGGDPVTLAGGSVGLKDFSVFEKSMAVATGVGPRVARNSSSYEILRELASEDGDPLSFSAPMAGAYIGMGARFCKLMMDEISGTSPNQRGFEQVSGLNRFNIPVANFTIPLQEAVIQKFAEMFWLRPATPSELSALKMLVEELKTPGPTVPSPSPAPTPTPLTTKMLGLSICTAVAGAMENIGN